jgi:peptidase M50B-like protein
VSLTQTPLSGSAAAVVGLAAFGLVASDIGWQFIRYGTVMAHEGAHAVLDSLLFREFDGIKLSLKDASGATGRKKDGGFLGSVILAFIGYVGPSLFGLGAARLIQTGHIVAVLWVTLFLLVLLAAGLRWSFGVITVPLAGGLVYVVGRYPPVAVQIVAAYAIAWLLLLSGVRGILVRGTGSMTGQNSPRARIFRSCSGSCCGWRPRWPRSPPAGKCWSCRPEPATGAGCGGFRPAGPVRPHDLPDMLALLPACRSGLELRRRAQYNKAPFMYEMKGALSGRAAQVRQLPGFPGATGRPPGPDTHVKHRFPGYSRVPGLPPDGARFQR